MRTPRILNRPRMALIAALSAPLALAACEEPAEPEVDPAQPDESMIMESPDEPLTGQEIEEAVPGIEDVTPEGDTPNTADLSDEENLDVTEDGAPGMDGPEIDDMDN